MFDLRLIDEIKKGRNVKQNMSALYFENLGIIHTLAGNFYLTEFDKEDILQMAYIALDGAVHAFRPGGGHSFLSYFRRCFLHECYQHTLLMKYPLKVPHKEFQKQKQAGSWSFYHYGSAGSLDFNVLDGGFLDAELSVLRQSVWNTVRAELSEKNCYIITKLYRDGVSKRELAAELKIGYERVRLREIRSLKKLRENPFLREIAYDYFSIASR